MLKVRDLIARYGDFQALFGIDFDLKQGTIVALIGANGAGKSTFLKSIAGQMPNKSGEIRFNSAEISGLPSDRVVRSGISLVPEGRRLFRSLTVEENLRVGAFSGRKGRWALDSVYALFPALRDKRLNPASALSGGQQQMVAIGRGLMANPDLLMCDEVSLGLAPAVIKDIYNVFPQLRAEGLSVIVVEQDIDAAMKVADYVYCFMHGRITLHGAPADLGKAQISAAYFGLGRREMIEVADTIIQGVLLGGLYALFAIGLSITYGVMRLVNIAHGDFLVLAAYLALWPVSQLHLHPFLTIIPIVILMFCLGYTVQRVVLNRTMGSNFLAPMLATFGMSVILRNGLQQVYHSDSRSFQIGELATNSIHIGDNIAIGVFPLIVFLTSLALTFLTSLLFSHTKIGMALRATSDDAETAGLMGIRAKHTYAVALGLSFALLAVGGIFAGIRTTFTPESGPASLLYAFEAVVIGGMGSLWGTFTGAVILGIAQGVGADFSAGFGILAGHLVFLAVLFFKPTGLFARTI